MLLLLRKEHGMICAGSSSFKRRRLIVNLAAPYVQSFKAAERYWAVTKVFQTNRARTAEYFKILFVNRRTTSAHGAFSVKLA